MSAPAAREAVRRGALMLGSTIFVLLIFEAALRIAGFTSEHHNSARMVDAHWRLLVDCYPSNPRGYFDIDLRTAESRRRYLHLAPRRYDAVAHRAPYAIECCYNSMGFRDAELGPKRPGVRRVLVLGDSFTEGQGVKEADTYPRVLERLLNEREPGAWEVRNCGRRGHDFPELYETFQQLLAFEPDVLLYGMVLNDAEQLPEFHARQTYVNDWILDRGRMESSSPQAPTWLQPRLPTFIRERWDTYRIARETTRWYRDMYGAPNLEGWRRTQDDLRAMDRRMRERGGVFLITSWPLLVGLDHGYPFAGIDETIERFCLSADIEFHNLRPALSTRSTPSLWVHAIDHHPNETAHRVAAEDLAPVVARLAPPRVKTARP